MNIDSCKHLMDMFFQSHVILLWTSQLLESCVGKIELLVEPLRVIELKRLEWMFQKAVKIRRHLWATNSLLFMFDVFSLPQLFLTFSFDAPELQIPYLSGQRLSEKWSEQLINFQMMIFQLLYGFLETLKFVVNKK